MSFSLKFDCFSGLFLPLALHVRIKNRFKDEGWKKLLDLSMFVYVCFTFEYKLHEQT